MLSFKVDQQRCIKCGECAADCPAKIIDMAPDGYPAIAPEKEPACYRCQHCLAVCASAAVSIFGLDPDHSELHADLPRPEQLATLMKVRRSVRRYQEEDLDPSLLQELLEVAWHAPTGVNSRQVRFTVVDERRKMEKVREEILDGVSRLVRGNALPERYARFEAIAAAWEEKRADIIFRDAPHLLIASAPQDVATPLADCLIALSYFELYAQSNGVGTVWGGLAKYAIDDLVPESRRSLGIPDNHLIGYAMMFGKPAVHYPRGVQHAPALIHRI